MAEAVLRIAGYSSPEFYTAHETRGYSLIPNMHGQYRKEGRSFVEINSAGFRDVEHTIAKAPGVTRIAIIGDSYVEALQVERDESFVQFMQAEIEKCGFGQQFEVLRFGVSGYGTAQQLLMLREDVLKYSPDAVILLMTTNNDISDNARVFKKVPIPYFEYREGMLVLDESFRTERAFLVRNSNLSRLGIWLKNSLRVVQAIGEAQTSIKYKYRQWKDSTTSSAGNTSVGPAPSPPVAEVGVDYQVYREPTDANWQNAWRVTEGILDLMNNEVRSANAKFVVVTGSNGGQVLPNVQERDRLASMLGINDLLYPDRRIAEFCRSKEIPVIALATALGDYTRRVQADIHGIEGNIGYGHWNKLGHQVAGTELGRRMCELR
ncbi:MAG: SGNH/GDSL hydrolase family protein [Acidobacteria bacterium]|nr:SGNH/GDSL hydrolase family protein [Acidobacteriota bacterium]